ncbi:iron-siderophore ABC transporter substrate-binding protein [Chamaesiphon minutus]|uniref:ABC-type Fe3+-hydroxamate transport system, periplasmic component n=1 Tax=Chamaesiphon minutus (strain ATCC 27169 / PCC 6605) TaxID=1173020 RepID=K9UGU8_CHAP6|nr:iron-siderophore ABC transporter substrate-binding protein [Chamaesiphon minutus]AFY93666.1 ABC-type Fe3+-hydroxamate transport system, periplasmic component [Chamaesiphon minutus PCC 6605]
MKFTNYFYKLVVAIGLLLTIAACAGKLEHSIRSIAPTANRANCQQIEHTAGTTQVCDRPQRIVVLGPYILEPLLALGVQPVAFGDYAALHRGEYTKPSQQIPYLGKRIAGSVANVGMAGTPSIEAIVKAKPDLILGIDIANTQHYQTLSKIAPTLILKWGDPDGNLQTIAQAVNRTERAADLLRETKQQIATARQAFAPLVATAPKLLMLISPDLREVGLVTKIHNRCSSLPQDLGFQLVYPQQFGQAQPKTFAPISLETFPDLDAADAIVLLGHNFRNVSERSISNGFEESQLTKLQQTWTSNPIARSLKASKAGKVYFIPSYLCLALPGPIGTQLYLEELKKQLLTTSGSSLLQ